MSEPFTSIEIVKCDDIPAGCALLVSTLTDGSKSIVAITPDRTVGPVLVRPTIRPANPSPPSHRPS